MSSSPPPVRTPTSAPARHLSHITLTSATPLEQLLRLVSSPSISPSVSLPIRETLSRHIRLLNPNDRPLAPLDQALADRVAALDAQVSTLSTRVQAAREAALSHLHTSFRRHVAQRCAPPSPKQVSSDIVATPPHRQLASHAAANHHAIVTRVHQLEKAAHSTRKRAASVREVLRIISDNVDIDPEHSRTIADDWTLTFSDLDNATTPRKRPAAELENARHLTSDNSPVPIAGGKKKVFLPVSPHITPRSKMRKKLLRTGRGPIRQPSFSSPLPR